MGPIYREKYQPDVPDTIAAFLQQILDCHNEASSCGLTSRSYLRLGGLSRFLINVTGYSPRLDLCQNTAKQDEWKLLDANCSKSIVETFCEASKLIIALLGNLSWLSWVQDRSLRMEESLPSWVPDLSTLYRPPSLILCGPYNVLGRIQRQWAYDDACYKPHYLVANDGGEHSNAGVQTDFRRAPSFSFLGQKPLSRAVRMETVRCIGRNFDNFGASPEMTSTLVLAASTGTIYHTGERWLEVSMNFLVRGHPHAFAFSGDLATAMNVQFDDLIIPFIELLQYLILC